MRRPLASVNRRALPLLGLHRPGGPFSALGRASRLTPFLKVVEALLARSAGAGSAWLVAVNDTFLAPVGAVASRCADVSIRYVYQTGGACVLAYVRLRRLLLSLHGLEAAMRARPWCGA